MTMKTIRGKMAAYAQVPAADRPTDATLTDYTNFHGMMCRPSMAQRCIDSFSGTILFMPTDTCPTDIARYDCGNGILNLWSYYLLVIFSLTGLSTLFKQTKFLVAETVPLQQVNLIDDETIVSKHNSVLKVDQNILNYVVNQTNSSSLQLQRKFEYHFGGLVPVSVMMLHFVCNKGLLHLVEVYQVERGRHVFSFLTDTLGQAVRWIVSKTAKQKQK